MKINSIFFMQITILSSVRPIWYAGFTLFFSVAKFEMSWMSLVSNLTIYPLVNCHIFIWWLKGIILCKNTKWCLPTSGAFSTMGYLCCGLWGNPRFIESNIPSMQTLSRIIYHMKLLHFPDLRNFQKQTLKSLVIE